MQIHGIADIEYENNCIGHKYAVSEFSHISASKIGGCHSEKIWKIPTHPQTMNLGAPSTLPSRQEFVRFTAFSEMFANLQYKRNWELTHKQY